MSFRLSSNDINFNDRVNSLFDSLESASKVHDKLPKEPMIVCDDKGINKEEGLVDKLPIKSNDFCFKRPFRPKPATSQRHMSKKYLPDYMKNPNKWTCYSLEHTECSNDSQNQIIASELMLSLKHGNDLTYTVENKLPDEGIGKKIEFHKTTDCNTNSSPSIKSAACSPIKKCSEHFILPNYEIGKIKNNLRKNTSKKQLSSKDKLENSKEIKLSHLCDEDDDDE